MSVGRVRKATLTDDGWWGHQPWRPFASQK